MKKFVDKSLFNKTLTIIFIILNVSFTALISGLVYWPSAVVCVGVSLLLTFCPFEKIDNKIIDTQMQNAPNFERTNIIDRKLLLSASWLSISTKITLVVGLIKVLGLQGFLKILAIVIAVILIKDLKGELKRPGKDII